jgi:hypothetical protein
MRTVPLDVRRRSRPLPAGPAGLVGLPALSSCSVRPPPKPEPVTTPTPDRRHGGRTDASTAVTGGSRAGSEPRSTHSPRRGELAQRVWQRSLELTSAGPGCHVRLPDQALTLARAARHDADTMAHALRLGRSRARHPSHDEITRRGVRLLERAIAYLGVKDEQERSPDPGDARRRHPRPRTALSLVREDQHHSRPESSGRDGP